jgi:kinesin family protein 1
MSLHDSTGSAFKLTFFLFHASFLAELAKNSECIIHMDGNMTTITKPEGPDGTAGVPKSFSFDHSYWSFDKNDPNYAGQGRLYEDLGVELLNHSFNGYNTCIVACT